VVLHVHREMPLSTPQRNSFRHRPARERAVTLEPKVVVEPPRGVSLDDEPRPLARGRSSSERLGRLPRTTLRLVVVERHLWIVARNATRSLPTGCKMPLFPAQTALGAGDKPVEGGENVRRTRERPSPGTSHDAGVGARPNRATRSRPVQRECSVRGVARPHPDRGAHHLRALGRLRR
jgi:hypothetical protein